MLPDAKLIESVIQGGMSVTRAEVRDMTGTGDHFEITVVSPDFEGHSTLERHRKLHRLFEDPRLGDVHAVKFKTFTPVEFERMRQK